MANRRKAYTRGPQTTAYALPFWVAYGPSNNVLTLSHRHSHQCYLALILRRPLTHSLDIRLRCCYLHVCRIWNIAGSYTRRLAGRLPLISISQKLNFQIGTLFPLLARPLTDPVTLLSLTCQPQYPRAHMTKPTFTRATRNSHRSRLMFFGNTPNWRVRSKRYVSQGSSRYAY